MEIIVQNLNFGTFMFEQGIFNHVNIRIIINGNNCIKFKGIGGGVQVQILDLFLTLSCDSPTSLVSKMGSMTSQLQTVVIL